MKFDGSRRRSSAGFIFTLGAAALATAPVVTAGPAVGSIFEGYTLGRRGSESNLRVRDTNVAPHEQPIRQAIRRSSAAAPSEADHASSAHLFPKRSMARVLHARQGGCLDSSANEDDINTLLWDGGADVRVALCPGAVITLTGAISFSNPNQEIYTVGYPTDDTRAKLVVAGQYQEVAIWNNCDRCTNTAIRNIAVDGSRQTLGRYGNSGLIEMGGNAKYQVVDGCNISNPRGWTAIHVAEGWQDSCSNQIITNNEIGPCGTSPNTAKQFRVVMTQLREFMATPKRLLKARQVSAPGQWADGISLACRDSTVTGNTITGATDGGIVLFGAPGSNITGNTIIAKGNTLLGGINLVDHGPFNGDYSGTIVSGNTIIADDAMIKIGVAVGLLAWGDYNSSDYRTTGGIITDNTFIANGNGTGYFGYGTAVGGNNGAVVDGNNYDEALFGGTTSYACQNGKTPTPQASIWDPYTTSGGSYQPGVTNLVDFNFLICTMPCQYDSTCGTNMTLVKNYPTVNTTASTTSWGTSTVPATVIRTPATTSTRVTSTTLSGTSTGVHNSTVLTGTTSGVTSTTGTGSTTGRTTTASTGVTTTTRATQSSSSTTSSGSSGSSSSLSSSVSSGSTTATSIATTSGTSTGVTSGTSTGVTTGTSTGTSKVSTSGTTSLTSGTTRPTTATSTKPATTTTSRATSTTSRVSTSSTTSRVSTTAKTTSTTARTTSTTSKATTTSTKPASTTTQKTTSTTSRPTTSTSVGLALGRGNAVILPSVSTTKGTVILLPVTSTKTTSSTKVTAKATSSTAKPTSTTSKKSTSTSTSAKTTSTTSKKTTSTTSKKTTSTTSKKATSTTSTKPTTSQKPATSTKATTSQKPTTTAKTTSKAATTSKSTSTTKSTSVFKSSSTKANLVATTTAALARTRGGGKRALEGADTAPRPMQRPRKAASVEVEEIEEQLRVYSQSLLRSRTKRDMDEVARLEHKLMVYRDWILPGAVRTPRPQRNLIDNEGIDKRDILADDAYWS